MKSKYAGRKTNPSEARIYNIIRRPLVTEKSTLGSENNQVSFEASKDASKPEIKTAVEVLFKVEVKAVNTLIRKGKNKRFRNYIGRQSDTKKAVVTLVDGSTLDVTTGI